jgi:hypothetical protein
MFPITADGVQSKTTKKRKQDDEEKKILHLTICNSIVGSHGGCGFEQNLQYAVPWSLVKSSCVEKKLDDMFTFLDGDAKDVRYWLDDVLESQDTTLIFTNEADNRESADYVKLLRTRITVVPSKFLIVKKFS